MMRNLTIGQYYSTESLLHSLDPRVKIRFVIAFILLSLPDRSVPLFALLTVVFLAALLLSRVPLLHMLKGMRGLMIFLCACSAINLFTTYGETVADLGVLTVTREGLIKTGFVLWRLLLLLLFSSLLMYTTKPTALCDGFEKCFHLPSQVAMGITIALRFLPVLVSELDRIMKAQEARGAEFHKGSPAKRLKSLKNVIIPLFQNSVRRAGNLADAMEARCYTGRKGRTRLVPLKYGVNDFVAYRVLLTVIAAGIFFIIHF